MAKPEPASDEDQVLASGQHRSGALAPLTAGEQDPALDYIERFAMVLIAAGFPPMAARVFVALLIAEQSRLTAADLASTLRISPAAVSGAVRYLIQLGVVHKDRVPGSRRDYYRMPNDVWTSMLRMRDQVMGRWATMLTEGIDMVGRDSEAGARMADHAAFFDFVSKEFDDIMDRWMARPDITSRYALSRARAAFLHQRRLLGHRRAG